MVYYNKESIGKINLTYKIQKITDLCLEEDRDKPSDSVKSSLGIVRLIELFSILYKIQICLTINPVTSNLHGIL